MKINRRTKTFLGWTFLIVISLLPIFFWIFYGEGFSEATDFGELTHALGEAFGLVGMTMFSLTFLLSTRISFIEDIFGGLDKVYIVHGILGGTALILILFHPIFLVLKLIPGELKTAALYLLPSSYWSVNFGIISLLGIIFLIYLTLYTKIKYHKWKFTHEFLGLFFLFAVLHIFMVRGVASGDNIFDGYYIYAGIVSFIGLSSFSYSLFIKNRFIKNAIYKIENIIQKRNFLELDLTPENKPLNYKSGQFVFLRFYNKNLSTESHPFSIASNSNSEKIKIIIKNLGDFTENIGHLNVGDKVAVEGPYGRFNFHVSKSKDQIWIAAGIGITPFIGMLADLEKNPKLDKNIDLYYTVRKPEDLIMHKMLFNLDKQIKNFSFIPWISSEHGRITLPDIYRISRGLNNKEILLCGPETFKENLIKDFLNFGVKKNHLHEEAFEFR